MLELTIEQVKIGWPTAWNDLKNEGSEWVQPQCFFYVDDGTLYADLINSEELLYWDNLWMEA